jgi:hypothetical protein
MWDCERYILLLVVLHFDEVTYPDVKAAKMNCVLLVAQHV